MKKVEIYSSNACPYCVKAKTLLKDKGVEYQEYRIDLDPALMEEFVKRSNGRKTVPQIFIDEEHIGGCDDLYALEEQGKLNPILAD
ncbi:MAG: glutaredoxin 3 [Deltaproteobacteria bacterium]|jgi:glutaredoxin 3|nr:glutaredoxin 3 [Deltaproteobacteria bacterium]MBW1914171.1 glutaredoxin 3 [Deltaproteobacteria bacterium]